MCVASKPHQGWCGREDQQAEVADHREDTSELRLPWLRRRNSAQPHSGWGSGDRKNGATLSVAMVSSPPRCAKQNTVGDLASIERGCFFHCNRYTNISVHFNIYVASDPQCHSTVAKKKEEVVSFVVTHLMQVAWTSVCLRATSWIYLNS